MTSPATPDGSRASNNAALLPAFRQWAWIPAIIVAVGLVGIAWALSSPVGSSPDDDFHLGSIWCSGAAADDLCQPTELLTEDLGNDVRESIANGTKLVRIPALVGPPSLCFAFDPATSAACQDQVNPNALAESRANDGLYPGGYYEAMSLFVGSNARRSVLLIRLATFGASMVLIAGAASTATPQLRRAYILAVAVTSVPLGLFLFASSNPSGIAVAGVGAAFSAGLSFLLARTVRESLLPGIVGLLAVIAALSARADAGLYISVAGTCALIIARAWRQPVRGRAIAVVTMSLTGIVWLMLSSQTSSATDGIGVDDGGWTISTVLWNNLVNLPSLWVGSWGIGWGLGWLDTRVPDVVSAGMVMLAGGLLFWGLGDLRRSKLLAAAIAVATIALLPMWLLAADRRLVGENLQPRYLLPLLPILFTVMLLPGRDLHRKMSLAQVVTLGLVLSVAQSLSLHANLRRYVTGQDIRDLNLDANIEWWWSTGPSPMVIWIVGTLAFSATMFILLSKFVWSGSNPKVIGRTNDCQNFESTYVTSTTGLFDDQELDGA